MRTPRSSTNAMSLSRFGRARRGAAAPATSSDLASDLRLFAITFVGGFLFVTVFVA
jgi:hypothetical protein